MSDMLAIACGYGVVKAFVRSQTEMDGLQEYYTSMEDYRRTHNIHDIIFTGGMTNQDYPHLSEAKTARDYYLKNIVMKSVDPPTTHLQPLSKNSYESIYFASIPVFQGQILVNGNKFDAKYDKVVVFCDKVRKTKMQIICMLLFGFRIKYKVVAFPRKDIHPNSNWLYQTFSTLRLIKDQRFWDRCRVLRGIIKHQFG
jgi:hypothetical protein